MSKNRWVNTRFWADNYIIDLDPSEKLLFLYCLTNDHTSICGAYEINIRTICLETGFDKDMVLKILSRFEKDNKIAYRDGWVIVRNFRKHQADNPKVRAGIEREESELPKNIKDSLYIGFDSLSVAYPTLLNLTLPNSTSLNSVTNKAKASLVTPAEAPPEDVVNGNFQKWLDLWAQTYGFPITKNLKENKARLNTLIRSHRTEAVKRALAVAAYAKRLPKKGRPRWAEYCTSFVKLSDFWDNIQSFMVDEVSENAAHSKGLAEMFPELYQNVTY